MSLPAPQVGRARVKNVHHYLRQLSRLHPPVTAVLGRYLPDLAMQDGVLTLAQRHQMRDPRTVSQPVGCFTGSRTCAGRDTVSTPASPGTRPLTAGSRQICHPAFYVPEFAERCKSERSRGAALRLYRSSSLSSPPAPGVAHLAPSRDTSQARRPVAQPHLMVGERPCVRVCTVFCSSRSTRRELMSSPSHGHPSSRVRFILAQSVVT